MSVDYSSVSINGSALVTTVFCAYEANCSSGGTVLVDVDYRLSISTVVFLATGYLVQSTFFFVYV